MSQSPTNFFDIINGYIRDIEGSFVNFISSIAPWGAPLPAAFMSYMHMDGVLKFPFYISIPVAITIEILGFSTISTGLDFWSWNRRYKSSDNVKRAPLTFVVAAFVFYLGLVLTNNVLLDMAKSFPDILSEAWATIAVRALLTLMTIPAAMIVATRTQHHELLDAIRQEKENKKKSQGSTAKFSSSSENHRTKEPSEKAIEVKRFVGEYYAMNSELPKLSLIMEKCSVVKSYASTLRTEWVEEQQQGE